MEETSLNIKPLFDAEGNRLYTLSAMASELGKCTERVKQHFRAGRIVCDQSYGVKLYHVAPGYHIEKGRIKENA